MNNESTINEIVEIKLFKLIHIILIEKKDNRYLF